MCVLKLYLKCVLKLYKSHQLKTSILNNSPTKNNSYSFLVDCSKDEPNGIDVLKPFVLAKQIGVVSAALGLTTYYSGHLHKFFLFNLPNFIESSLQFVLDNFVTEIQKHRMCICTPEKMSPLHDTFAAMQLETRYGGSRPMITGKGDDNTGNVFKLTVSEASRQDASRN